MIFKNMKKNFSRNYSVPAHPYHLVDVSPWPILMSFGLLSLALALVSWLTLGQNSLFLYFLVIINIIFISYQWLKDVVREGKAGYHTKAVVKGIEIAFYLFLLSEIKIFFSIFWTYFHSS